jgi:hypothetical protein
MQGAKAGVLNMAGSESAFRFEIAAAEPLLLHGDFLPRTDANSPVLRYGGRTVAIMSHYNPIGHSYRRVGNSGCGFTGPLRRVFLIDDPAAAVGKWIESVWRAPSGDLYGWYHAEEMSACPTRLFVPHIGALVSHDDGLTWRCLGAVLKAPHSEIDCGYRNGFLAGGYGDFCVLPDRDGRYFYFHFSSYVANERAQGIAVARCPIDARDAPVGELEVWQGHTWMPASRTLPCPIWPVARGWRNRDPDSFWGPAIHYNRDLNAYVMLLNHTQHGTGDIRQEGVFVSFNERLDDPVGWRPPIRVVAGGVWYPEVVGLGDDDGDTQAGARARFFMSGFSAWEIAFRRSEASASPSAPIVVDHAAWVRLFGSGAPRRLGIG